VRKFTGIDLRLERLDRAAAEIEQRIRQLTYQAQQHAAHYNYPGLYETLKAAEKLQRQNSRLFKVIQHTEGKLTAVAKKVADEVKQIEK